MPLPIISLRPAVVLSTALIFLATPSIPPPPPAPPTPASLRPLSSPTDIRKRALPSSPRPTAARPHLTCPIPHTCLSPPFPHRYKEARTAKFAEANSRRGRPLAMRGGRDKRLAVSKATAAAAAVTAAATPGDDSGMRRSSGGVSFFAAARGILDGLSASKSGRMPVRLGGDKAAAAAAASAEDGGDVLRRPRDAAAVAATMRRAVAGSPGGSGARDRLWGPDQDARSRDDAGSGSSSSSGSRTVGETRRTRPGPQEGSGSGSRSGPQQLSRARLTAKLLSARKPSAAPFPAVGRRKTKKRAFSGGGAAELDSD